MWNLDTHCFFKWFGVCVPTVAEKIANLTGWEIFSGKIGPKKFLVQFFHRNFFFKFVASYPTSYFFCFYHFYYHEWNCQKFMPPNSIVLHGVKNNTNMNDTGRKNFLSCINETFNKKQQCVWIESGINGLKCVRVRVMGIWLIELPTHPVWRLIWFGISQVMCQPFTHIHTHTQ